MSAVLKRRSRTVTMRKLIFKESHKVKKWEKVSALEVMKKGGQTEWKPQSQSN